VFGALSSIILWLIVGLTWALPQRYRAPTVAAVVLFTFSVAATAPFLVIAPTYQPPAAIAAESSPITTFNHEDGTEVSLLMADVRDREVRPGDYVMIDTRWTITEPAPRDWSLFVHLTSADGVIISQRDVYPGRGLLATSDLAADFTWENPLAVWVPATAYTPQTLNVNIGWYYRPSGERLARTDGAELVTVGQVDLLPRESAVDVPNPLSINFGDKIELVGYTITDLSPHAGGSTQLTLYWRGLRDMTTDYKLFANIIDPTTLTKYAASDGMPVNWQAPTSTWAPGTIIEDQHILDIAPDAPPGIYELEVGWYREDDGSRLRVITPDGGQADNFIRLNRVRILPARPGD
jgi:hypothetical protein